MAVVNDQGKRSPSQDKAAYAGPVSVGRFIAPIAGKTLSRGGTVLAELLAEWPAIAGPSLAGYTSPQKLTKAAPEEQGKAAPSVLHLKVDPARVLDVQYSTPQLIERINQTLGFRAVSGLRLVQAPVQKKPQVRPRALKAAPVDSKPKEAAAAPPNRLAAALARMSEGVKARGCSG